MTPDGQRFLGKLRLKQELQILFGQKMADEKWYGMCVCGCVYAAREGETWAMGRNAYSVLHWGLLLDQYKVFHRAISRPPSLHIPSLISPWMLTRDNLKLTSSCSLFRDSITNLTLKALKMEKKSDWPWGGVRMRESQNLSGKSIYHATCKVNSK